MLLSFLIDKYLFWVILYIIVSSKSLAQTFFDYQSWTSSARTRDNIQNPTTNSSKRLCQCWSNHHCLTSASGHSVAFLNCKLVSLQTFDNINQFVSTLIDLHNILIGLKNESIGHFKTQKSNQFIYRILFLSSYYLSEWRSILQITEHHIMIKGN